MSGENVSLSSQTHRNTCLNLGASLAERILYHISGHRIRRTVFPPGMSGSHYRASPHAAGLPPNDDVNV